MGRKITEKKPEKVPSNDISESVIELKQLETNSEAIFTEFDWLIECIQLRFAYAKNASTKSQIIGATPPDFSIDDKSSYAQLIQKYQFSAFERLTLAIAMARSMKPEIFEPFIDRSTGIKIISSGVGGIMNNVYQKFLPTVRTAIHIMYGENRAMQNSALSILRRSQLINLQIIRLKNVSEMESELVDMEITLTQEYFIHLLESTPPRPEFGMDFPARGIHSSYDLEDLITTSHVKKQIERIIQWNTNKDKVLKRSSSGKVKVNPGFPVLFYGPPGTGKTMAAGIIGKVCNKEVYQVDLSMITSKYIGETEKNLKRLFDKAEHQDWVLFFDEADALFGKRTNVKDSHDKYANQEMSYLLQRMESFSGLSILATNFDNNLDDAMTRRFQSKVYFGLPDKKERADLWKKLLPTGFEYDTALSMDKLSEVFKFSGANIANVLSLCRRQ